MIYPYKSIDDGAFEVWIAKRETFDAAEKLHPTVYLMLSRDGSDFLSPPPVRVSSEEFEELTETQPERIVVWWPEGRPAPLVLLSWWNRLVDKLALSGFHTVVLFDDRDDRDRWRYAVNSILDGLEALRD